MLSGVMLEGGVATAGGGFHGCGQIASLNSFEVRAKNVGCRKARRVVRRYNAAITKGSGFTVQVLHFHCLLAGTYGEGGKHRCSRDHGARVVRFLRGG